MSRTRRILIGTASALAIAALPVNLASLASGSLEPASAFAKGGHGGGGGGGGHGGGGHGHSGEHGKSGKQGGSGSSTKSAERGRTKTTTEKLHGAKSKTTADRKLAKASPKKKTDQIETAALPEEAPLTEPKAKKLNARLAGLNSLNRNYHAYLNSQSPRMAKIRDFVLASANLDIAQSNFDTALTAAKLAAYDDSTIYSDDPTLQDLEDRLAELQHLEAQDPTTLSDEDLEALRDEEAALESFLDGEEATALDAAETLGGTDDAALREALLDAANKNRVAQYGDDYLNDDVMTWARDVLGVGEAVGKIDEVRETLDDE